MSLSNVLKALEKRLATLTPAIPTASENGTYQPQVGVAYQALAYVGEVNEAPVISDTNGYIKKQVLYQIMVCFPSAQGPASCRARADLIVSHFKKSTVLIESGTRVEINFQPEIGPPSTLTGWFCLPVRIRTTTVIQS